MLTNSLPVVSIGAHELVQGTTTNGDSGSVNASFGSNAITGIGDVNGDGFDDYAVGSVGEDSGGLTNNGSVTVFSGLDNSQIWKVNGTEDLGQMGGAVARLGDINGDGFDELVVALPYSGTANGIQTGRIEVRDGTDGSLLATSIGFAPGDRIGFGGALSGAGDVNNDGVPDFIAGSRFSDTQGTDSGRADIFSGDDGSLIRSLNNVSAANVEFGISVAGIGDINSDGFDDVLVGGFVNDIAGTDSGSAWVFSGSNGAELQRLDGAAGDRFGRYVTGLGDINGDDVPDFAVGATNDDNNGLADSGSVRVVSGSDFSTIFTLNGDGAGDAFGVSVAGPGDVTGDGVPDIAVGVGSDDNLANNGGSAQIFDGSTGLRIAIFDGENADDQFGRNVAAAGDLNGDGFADVLTSTPYSDEGGASTGSVTPLLSSLAAPGQKIFSGVDSGERFGFSVSDAGDVNGDGIDDYIVGTPYDDTNGTRSGRAVIFSGADDSELHTFLGDDVDDRLGFAVAAAGDVNGDGFDDVIVSLPTDATNGNYAGAARVFSGADGSTLRTFLGKDADDIFGISVAGAGDVNGDGFDDVIVGASSAANADDSVNNVGSAQIFSGADGSVLHAHFGGAPFDSFGVSVSGVGDVNGDGFDDYILGSSDNDDNGSNAGKAEVFSGANGAVLFTLTGTAANNYFGFASSGTGDVNGDGFPDFIVGARGDDTNGPGAGRATVFSGADGRELHSFYGSRPGASFGFSVSDAGDVNGDGFADLIVGSFFDSTNGGNAGSAQVFSGADGRLLQSILGDGPDEYLGRRVSGAGDINGDGLDDIIVGAPGVYGSTTTGSARLLLSQPAVAAPRTIEGAAQDLLGRSVSDAGDVNGDGFDDVIIGLENAMNGDGDRAGAAVVLSGIDGTTLFRFEGDSAYDDFGNSVSGAGDVNGDGFADLIVGARFDDDNGSASGSARVFSGADGSVLHTFLGAAAYDDFGGSVSEAGDVNGDGFDDVIVGAKDADGTVADSGVATVFSGIDGTVLHTLNGDSAFDDFGFSVSGAGDVNGDGFDDVIVGARYDDDNGSSSGSAKIFSGFDGSVLHTFLGDDASDRLGFSVSDAGDVNGDGTPDVIVGANGDDNNGSSSGSARVFSGADGTVLHTFNGDSSSDDFGRSVSGAGDVNGDGFADLIVGADEDEIRVRGDGSARVFSGFDGAVLATFAGDQIDGELGNSVSAAGDVNGDGFADVIVGAYDEDLVPFDRAGSATIYLGTPRGFVPMSSLVQPFPNVAIGGRDDTTLSGMIVSIQGPSSSDGTDLIVAPETLPAGVFSAGYSQSTGEITFFGLADLAVYEQLLRDIRVTPSAFGGGRSISVEVIDAGGRVIEDPAASGVGSALVLVNSFDFGDAPATFEDRTLPDMSTTVDQARHQYSDLFLGTQIDVNSSAVSSPDATGDDGVGGSVNDDDGITFTSPIARGQGGVVEVVSSGAGTVAFWIDYDQSGTFDESERREQDVVAGVNTISFAAAGSAIVGDTFARFRLSSDADAVELPTGAARDGEVEDYAVTVLQTQREWGDAPASYSAGGGTPFHNRGTNIHWLGAGRSLEPTPNINADATGDDLDDGVTFLTPLARNQGTTMQVVASEPGELSYWIDFDNSGTFDNATEKFTRTLSAGVNTFAFVTPGSAVLGDTFARFRFSSSSVANPTGAASNGEVEDYQVEILTTQREFGDAPDSYRTSTATNGPRHNLGPNTHFLGTTVDREPDANISLQADADDTTDLNDDDGVTFTSLIAAGQTASVDVVASRPGELSYWIDFDLSGTFDNATERFTATLVEGSNSLTYAVPANAVVGTTFSRFRFSTNAAQIQQPFGVASNGEVEDYRVEIVPTQFDFGDAPASYGTSLASGGARHAQGTGNVFLGAGRDLEADGTPSGFANSDDAAGVPNDEDGITFTSSITVGLPTTFTAVASVGGTLSYWIDFNRNGVFQASERFESAVTAGSNNLSFTVPGSATSGASYARFRFDTASIANPTGLVNDGEVEDYRITIESSPALQASDSFFGDEDELAELLGSLS